MIQKKFKDGIIYYTGHGNKEGNWCADKDYTVSLKEVVEIFKTYL